jgi:sulfite reductase beta subunit-like hemoprotein
MSIEDTRSFGRARLSFADENDIDEFVAMLQRFERGEVGPDEWRAFRLVRGTYGQRQPGDVSMVRVKIPQGVLDARQLRALGDVADRFSRGFCHVTTRQNVQLHFVRLHDVEPAMRLLAEAGLTTREACGNSVRNITACPYAGTAADERFDVTPYAEALTRHLLRHPLSSTLPRKFKIAFEGCAEDHVSSAINDIGWRARVDGGRRGFRVTAGGGTATVARSGFVLWEFLPAAQILDAAESILRVFHRLGDRTRKHRSRMKFLIQRMGWDAFRNAIEEERRQIARTGGVRLPFDPDSAPVEGPPAGARPRAPSPDDVFALAATRVRGPGLVPDAKRLPVASGGLARWAASNVRAQRQPGFALCTVTLPLGDLVSGQMRVLASLALAYGDGTVRTTVDQNLLLRWVRRDDVPALHQRLAAAGLALPGAGSAADVTACPGAESCKLAVTQSRGMGRVLSDHLRARPDLVAGAPELKIKISGCPNGCGQHHIAGIGLRGSFRKIDGRAVPQYFVMVGGGVADDGAHFARLAAKIPARRMPQAIERLIAIFRAERAEAESAADFFRRVPLDRVQTALHDLGELTAESAAPEDFIDLGEDHPFTPETTEGECAA